MRDQVKLKAEVAAAIKEAGIAANVAIFKRRRSASSIRITKKNFQHHSDGFDVEIQEKLLEICNRFDLRGPGGDRYTAENVKWSWGCNPCLFWWIFT